MEKYPFLPTISEWAATIDWIIIPMIGAKENMRPIPTRDILKSFKYKGRTTLTIPPVINAKNMELKSSTTLSLNLI